MLRSLDYMTHVVLWGSSQTDNQRLRFIFSINADAFERQLSRFSLCSDRISEYLQACNRTFVLFAEGLEEAGPFITRNFSCAHLTSHSSGKSFGRSPCTSRAVPFCLEANTSGVPFLYSGVTHWRARFGS